MEKRPTSAADVARAAGVSRTTVSFVLNNTPGKSITEATRQRVLDAATRLGYTPNENAQRLARTRSRTVGLFICHSQFIYSDVFITRVLEGMSQAVNRYRARLVVQPVSLRDTDYRDIVRRDGVDGIILINAHEEDPALRALADEDFPTVSMDYLDDVLIDQVYVDNEAAARQVTEYLIGLGHRRIAMIAHAPGVFLSARKRFAGYRRALEHAGIPFDPGLVRHADFSEESGFVQMEHLLRAGTMPSAVFAGNDVVAYGALQAIQQAELRVPEDISLAGFDDDYVSRFLNPPLSTMALPAAGHGSAAVNMLMTRIEEGERRSEPRPVRRLLSSHISVRDSCAPPVLLNSLQ